VLIDDNGESIGLRLSRAEAQDLHRSLVTWLADTAGTGAVRPSPTTQCSVDADPRCDHRRAGGALRPVVGGRYPPIAVREAHQDRLARRITGVLVPATERLR